MKKEETISTGFIQHPVSRIQHLFAPGKVVFFPSTHWLEARAEETLEEVWS
jgi:hypothetical protein